MTLDPATPGDLEIEWRAIPGYRNYEASATGLIRPVKPRYSRGRGATIKPWVVSRHGRDAEYVSLHVDGRRSKHLVHRLVALAFLGEAPLGCRDVAHKNHDSLDNRVANLRWSSHADNVAETAEIGVERRALLDESIGELCYTGSSHGCPF